MSNDKKEIQIEEAKWVIREEDLLIDLKIILKDYYVATLTSKGTSLKISFSNGQSFKVCIAEI